MVSTNILAGILPLLVAPLAVVASPAPIQLPAVDRIQRRDDLPSIHELLVSRGNGSLYFGAATEFDKNQNTKDIIKNYLGQVTPELTMKWRILQPSEGQFDWTQADALVNWAMANGKSIRGHTLLWWRPDLGTPPLPGWVTSITDANRAKAVLEKHVKTVVGHFKGKIRAWDVVNEIFNDDAQNTFRESVFYKLLGEDFVGIAFRAAREADPNAKLYINDYGLDSPDKNKLKVLVRKVKEWKAKGIPIDGIGSQTHISTGQSNGIAGALGLMASVVNEVAITELDIAGGFVGEDWWKIVKACVYQAKCVGITTWGVSDKDSPRYSKGQRPLLWDDQYNVKPHGYWPMVDWLKGKFSQ